MIRIVTPLAIILFCISILVFFIGGYALNVIAIVSEWGGEFTALLILRLIGLLVGPLGAALGWFV